MPTLKLHPDYIIHEGKKIKAVLDIEEYNEIQQKLEQIGEYEEALQLSKDSEFAQLVQQALSSPTVLKDKSAKEVLNEI